MKKILFTLIFLSILIPLSSFLIPNSAHAQDEPNANITKRRPDKAATYSPTPVATSATKPAEVKQVETGSQSFLAKLWDQIKSFFVNLFKQPEASTTSAPTTP